MDLDNKIFDAEVTQEIIVALEDIFRRCSSQLDLIKEKLDKYINNDTYQGDDAEASKEYVGDVELGIHGVLCEVQEILLGMYKHYMTSFSEKVDASLNARLETQVLAQVETDFKGAYKDLDSHSMNIERKAEYIKAKYGHITTFTVPCYASAKGAYIDLCGGDNSSYGYINDVKERFISFDEEECEYIDAQDLSLAITKLQKSVQDSDNLLMNVLVNNPRQNGFFLKNIKTAYFGIVSDLNDVQELLKEKIKRREMERDPYYQISNQDAREIIREYDLTAEQMEYIYKLENLVGTKNALGIELTEERVAGMQVMAAALFAEGKSPEFIAAVLGNVWNEGGVGHIEDTTYDDPSNRPSYLQKVLDYYRDEYNVDFQDIYANELLYEMDLESYSLLISSLIKYTNPETYNCADINGDNVTDVILGIGSCQWTDGVRVLNLLDFYKKADAMGDQDGKLSFKEAAKAEADMLIFELTSSQWFLDKVLYYEELYSGEVSDNYLDNEALVRQAAVDFYDIYENGDTATDGVRATDSWIIYKAMME
ncbi:phage tail tip lysozyme [Butyrivibrio proteoclasticus]|uniref:phage tail tip lysozyme n=1 Tax=Butyrivibrio proteoclasticus TaxID=43305 RepID=UPI00047ADA45|nr:phage tail tip lysozyme [Butyrivibrio proteoclasticus]